MRMRELVRAPRNFERVHSRFTLTGPKAQSGRKRGGGTRFAPVVLGLNESCGDLDSSELTGR